jgi:hypothetical protein
MEQKKSDFIHFLYTPFTGLGLHKVNGYPVRGYKGDEWLKYRIEIFKNYTLKSLLNQTNRDFIHWLSFRPEERTNKMVQQLYALLCLIEYPCIFTFDGLMFWDDKFLSDDLLARLGKTLPELEEQLKDKFEGKRYVLETLVPSDDMYHKDMVESVQAEPYSHKRALIHWNGYVYNQVTNQFGTWNPPKGSCPPFYTVMYPLDDFLNPKKHFNYWWNFKSHEDIEKCFRCKRMPDNRYCVLVHKENISTAWDIRERGLKTLITLMINPFNWKRLYVKARGSLNFIFRKKILGRHPFIGREFRIPFTKRKILKCFGL